MPRKSTLPGHPNSFKKNSGQPTYTTRMFFLQISQMVTMVTQENILSNSTLQTKIAPSCPNVTFQGGQEKMIK